MKQFYIFLVAAMLVCGNSVFAQQQPSTPAKPAAPAKPAVKLAPAKPARPARPARPKPPEEKPEPGDAELAELKKAYDVVKEKIVKEKVEKAALTERMNVWIANNPLNEMSKDFFYLIEKFPKSRAALRATTLLITQGNAEVKEKAIDILIRDFADDERIIRNMNSIATGMPSTNTESWLTQLVEKSTNKRIQGTAIQAHLDYIRSVSQVDQYAAQTPGFYDQAGNAVKQYMDNYDFEKAEATRYRLLKRLSTEFADVPSNIVNQTFGQRADRQLYIIEKLSVGRPAMEIEGEGLGGEKIKLSDYKDKVVLLIFWGDWAPPATRMYPHLRSIKKKLKGKPFEIVGLNSDDEKEFAKAMVEYQQFDWPSIWLGGKQSPITSAWKVTSWPTTYIIDGTGKIRYKQVQKVQLDEAIATCMKEAGHVVDFSDHKWNDNKFLGNDVRLVGTAPKPKKANTGNTLNLQNPKTAAGGRAGLRPGQRPGARPGVRPTQLGASRRAPFPGPVISGRLPDLDGDGRPGVSKKK